MAVRKKSASAPVRFVAGVFEEPVMLFTCSADEFVREVGDRFGCDASGLIGRGNGGLHLQFEGESGCVEVIWIPRWSGGTEDEGLLVHECVHAAVEMLKARNVPVVPEGNSEMLAYLTAHLYRELRKRLAGLECES